MKIRTLLLALGLCILFSLPVCARAAEAADLSDSTAVTGEGYESFSFLFDKNVKNYKKSGESTYITLENDTGIGSIYLLFDLEYGPYTLTDNISGDILTVGEQGFLHEYIELKDPTTSVTLSFESGAVRLSEIYVFSQGEAPAFVQRWNAPFDGGADILLLSTHGDDDQLFFAGLLPLYAGEQGCRVQVAYLTDHRNLTNARTHEMLNGLWAVGVTAYPVFGRFPDFRIDDLQGSYDEFASQGHSEEDLLAFVTEQLRRFRPQAVVGHDIEGEYGHGMHMVYTDCLIKALEISNDPSAFPGLAEKYGTWDVPKTYLHLYQENPIEIDYDQPLDTFDGMTAFEVSQKLGYPCHESQQFTWFTGWINGKSQPITQATQIKTHNPCKFGLYRSTVGPDVEKNDFLENLTTYAEQERLEQERLEQERLEQERLEAERLEQERLEQERLEQQRLEQERLEQERLEAERLEQQRLEEERKADESQKKRTLVIAGSVLAVLMLILGIVLGKLLRRKKTHPPRR